MADSPGTLCWLREERLLEQKGERVDDMTAERCWGGLITGTEYPAACPCGSGHGLPHPSPLLGDLQERALMSCSLPPLTAFLETQNRRGMSGYISVGLKHRAPLSPLCCPLNIQLCAYFQGENSSRCPSYELLQTGILSIPGT